MIDERQEELASLYALDLLEGAEWRQFESTMARDPGLQALVRDLRAAGAALAHSAPASEPPAALKARVLESVAQRTPATTSDKVERGAFFGGRTLLPWAIAAGFAVVAGLVAQKYFTAQTTAELLRDQSRLAELARQDIQQHLEAERLLNRRQMQTLDQQLAAANTQLGETRTQLADAGTRLTQREQQLATLTQRVETLVASSAERLQLLQRAQQRIEELVAELKTQGDLANLKIAALASMLDNSPQALAVAVWSPEKQEGVLSLEKMPPLARDQKLELWVVEAKPGAKPVSAGVLAVGAEGAGRIRFKPTAPVTALAAFAMSREKDDGAIFHLTPAEVIMMGPTR